MIDEAVAKLRKEYTKTIVEGFKKVARAIEDTESYSHEFTQINDTLREMIRTVPDYTDELKDINESLREMVNLMKKRQRDDSDAE